MSMKRRQMIWATCVMCCALALCAAAETAMPAAPGEKVFAEAQRILLEHKESHYQHSTKVDEAEGAYDLDCSGLACVVLQKVAPESYKAVKLRDNGKRPLAVQFYETFAAAPAEPAAGAKLQHVVKLLDARPGDVLAWRVKELVEGKSTGHVMIVATKPVLEKDGLVRIEVIDSTGHGHANDTRPEGQSGIGRGTMWFEVDEKGAPIGYIWKQRDSKPHHNPIAVGRALAGK